MSNIDIQHLTKEFNTGSGPIKVLDDVSFKVDEGEFICLLGPSGSGKSVTLNCIAGQLDASEGEIKIDGVSVREREPHYGYIFQQPRLMPWRTVEENLLFALRAESGRPLPDEKQRVRDVLDLVSLSGYEKFYMHQISGGMQNRVSIARAYVRNPDLLLMDEPFGALDEMTARRLRSELVATWMRDRRTVVFVTHDIVEACYLADRIVVYSPKPTRIAEIIEIKIPRPREYGSPEMHQIESKVLAVFERTMKDFMQIIKDEHRAMASVYNELIKHIKEIESGGVADFDHLEAMMEYLLVYPEKIHHPKEDEYLFDALMMRSPHAKVIVEELKDEHRLGGELLNSAIGAMGRYKANRGTSEFQSFSKSIHAFIDLQWRHMNKEEKVLMPMASQFLKGDDWVRVSDAFRSNDNPLFGIKAEDDSNNLKKTLSGLRA